MTIPFYFQTDLIGQYLSDFVHDDDYDELLKPSESEEEPDGKRLLVRMKSVLTPRGRSLNLKSAGYRVMRFFSLSLFPPSRNINSV